MDLLSGFRISAAGGFRNDGNKRGDPCIYRGWKAAPTGVNLVGVMEYCRFRDLVSRLHAPTSDAFIDNRRGGVYPHPQAFYCFRALRALRG